MKSRIFLLLAIFAFATRSEALTDKGKEAVKQLEAAMKAEAKESSGGEDRAGGGNVRSAMISRLKSLLASPDSGQNLQETLNQLPAYFTSDAVIEALALLQEEIRLQREAEDKAAVGTIQDALNRAAKAVREAQGPADLDVTIAELGKLRQRVDRGSVSESVRIAIYQVEPTLQFVTQWQNYLSATVTGNAQSAQEALRSLSNSNAPSLIPRSEILKLLAAPGEHGEPEQPSHWEAVEKILAGTKSLADIETSIRQLRKLQDPRSNFTGRDSVNQLIQTLLPIDKTYQDFKAGLAANIEISQNYGGGQEVGNATIARLKMELLLLMLPRYVGAPEGTRAQPGEDVQHFLDRLTTEAKARGDIAVGIRSREALRLLQRGNSFSGNDTAGLSAYVSAQNQEAAGQYLLAVISYQTALKSGSDILPAKVIGERLAALQAEHPKEFEAGMDRFLNPPVPRFEGLPGGRFPGGGMPQQGAPPASPALLIPPAPVSSPTPSTKN